MDNTTKLLISELKEFNPLALLCYHHYLELGAENGILFSLDELYEIIISNFEALLDKNILNKALSIFHYTIQNYEMNDEILRYGAEFFNNVNAKYAKEEKYQNLIFELLHQFLASFSLVNKTQINFVSKFHIINVYSDSKVVRQRSRLCLELLIKVVSDVNILMDVINYDHPYFGELFTHFIYILLKEKELYKKEDFWVFCLRNLLNENRKFAIYWLKVLIQQIESLQPKNFEVPNFFKWTHYESADIINSWYLYITILESLDGKQSHLILPSLEHLKNLKIFGVWKQFIICDIMKHTNTLVLKWATNFVLDRYTCDEFDILDKYLDSNDKSLSVVIQGFNNTFLYNDTNRLQPDNFKKFINKNPKMFFATFVDVNWKSIPLFILIHSLDDVVLEKVQKSPYQLPLVSTISQNDREIFKEPLIINENLFKLAGKIRRIENKIIRMNVRSTFFKKFEIYINWLKAKNYFKLLECLFNDNEEKSENEIMLIQRKLKQMQIKNISIEFGLLKTLLEAHNKFDESVNSKIYNDILPNCCLNDMLTVLTFTHNTYKNNLIEIIECKLENYDQSEDTTFLQIYLKMFVTNSLSLDNDRIINDAFKLVSNDFKNVGRSYLKNYISFPILKQTFVDQVAAKIFDRYENQLVEVELTLKDLKVENYILENVELDINIEMLLSKGSFETLNQFLKRKILSKIFLCLDFKTKRKCFNINLYKIISSEILTNSKKYGFKYVVGAITGLINYVVPEFPDVLNYILDIDQSNYAYFNITFSTVSENILNLKSSLRDFYSSDSGLNFLLRGLLYGEPLLGEPRIEYEFLIKTNLTEFLVSPLKIRKLAAELTHYLICNVFSSRTVLLLRDKLLTESENLNNRKSRYFKNSKQHRLKLRITQALAILASQGNLTKEVEWTDRYLKAIFEESNQTDVTYIMELVIAKTMPISKLFQLLENCSNLNNSCIISLFVISFIVCYNYIGENDIESIKKIVKLILPWTMGQNFNIRLYSQITIYNLIKYFKLEDYDILSESILESLKQGTPEKNYKKFNHDFRFQKPELGGLLKLHVLYYGIPRLNNTEIDEWYNEDLEYDCSNLFSEFYEETEVQTCEELITTKLENIQRKINPIIIDENCFPLMEKSIENRKDSDIIVIASLIDKLPNLGGIARTCEVLGIRQLAINSLKYAETKEFKGLSMTAEKWLSLFELKVSNITNYFLEMKSNGYQIIGAEQTANSENFINFIFPKKTILLLGHEKQGIPPNLIAYLDRAVEIPQFGMVRSLNVHVTGALFMWEYCKQHIATKK